MARKRVPKVEGETDELTPPEYEALAKTLGERHHKANAPINQIAACAAAIEAFAHQADRSDRAGRQFEDLLNVIAMARIIEDRCRALRQTLNGA